MHDGIVHDYIVHDYIVHDCIVHDRMCMLDRYTASNEKYVKNVLNCNKKHVSINSVCLLLPRNHAGLQVDDWLF